MEALLFIQITHLSCAIIGLMSLNTSCWRMSGGNATLTFFFYKHLVATMGTEC